MLSVIVPTYNEGENVGPLLERIERALGDRPYDYEVVVVDDDSPDGTWRRAAEYADRYPVTAVRRLEEQGLATAVVRGIEEASSDRIAVMDADLQHPPEALPEFVDRLRDGADVVVGSRKAPGGSYGDFGPGRRIVSAAATLLARIAVPELRAVDDVQSGFFAFRRDVVEGRPLSPSGYKILIEILAVGSYAEVAEVGYAFDDRRAGESNLDAGVASAYLRHLADLRRRRTTSERPSPSTTEPSVGESV